MTPSEARRKKLKPQTPENLAKIDNALIEAFVAKNNIFALKILFYIAKMKIELDENSVFMIGPSEKICSGDYNF